MSAFFVSQPVIDKAVYCTLLDPHSLIPGWIATTEEISEAGRALWLLNIEALKQRYTVSSTEEEEYRAEATRYRFQLCRFAPVVALKGLHCWLYQCTEGDVPRSELYCRMKSLSDTLGRSIVCKLPEYRDAAWDG